MNNEDIQILADMLSKFEPGFLPYPIFEQVARIVALSVVEFVPLRLRQGEVEVLLIARDKDDAYWPGMLHTPGTVIRATDLNKQNDNWTAFNRLIEDELKNTKISDPHYFGSLLNHSKRGVEQSQLYWVEVLEDPKVGSFYPVNNLPTNLISSQDNFIKEATLNFSEYKSKS